MEQNQRIFENFNVDEVKGLCDVIFFWASLKRRREGGLLAWCLRSKKAASGSNCIRPPLPLPPTATLAKDAIAIAKSWLLLIIVGFNFIRDVPIFLIEAY